MRRAAVIANRFGKALPLVLVAGVILSGCGSTPSPSGSSPSVQTSDLPANGEVVLGCWSIAAAECRFVAEQVVTTLPAARGTPFAIEIELYGCEGDPCPPTLGVREGTATIEYADGGEPVRVGVAGPPNAPRFGKVETAWSGLIEPGSARVAGSGPFPFELGHCGLSWQVDFDGSFWLVDGQVDGDASGVINAEAGQIVLLGPNVAQYRGQQGFTGRLARFPGPKHLWLCA